MQESSDLMRYWHDAPRRRRDVVTIPTIWLAFVLSLVVHLAALWEFLPKLPLLPGEASEESKVGERLAVRLAPAQSQAPSTPSPPAQGAPAASARAAQPASPKPRAPKATPLPAPTPPVVATAPPLSDRPAVPAPAPPVAPPPAPSPPIEGDLSSFIAARRRARGESEPSPSIGSTLNSIPAESDAARRDRIVAANLASLNAPTFGTEPKNSGGIFQIRRLGYDDAEFTFFGWSKDIKRRTSQKFEVRKGDNSDIRVIEIIRDYEQEDFSWSSQRLGRVLVLSARPADNAGLEDFMMQEFFSTPRP